METLIRLFFDTEFTRLNDLNAELISIGITDESGRHEFYAELEHDKDSASEFVVQEVYPLLLGIEKPASEVKANLMKWLGQLRQHDEIVVFCCDYSEDIDQFHNLMGELPEWIKVLNIARLIYTAFHFFFRGKDIPMEHHALHDARELRNNYLNSIQKVEDIL